MFWFMLCCDLLIPVVMIVAGWAMWNHPPQSINGMIGYRTTRSMQNRDTWKFAHDYSGRLWWKTGWIALFPSIVVHIFTYGKSEHVIGLVGIILTTVQMIVLTGSVWATERALKRFFTDTGVPRSPSIQL